MGPAVDDTDPNDPGYDKTCLCVCGWTQLMQSSARRVTAFKPDAQPTNSSTNTRFIFT